MEYIISPHTKPYHNFIWWDNAFTKEELDTLQNLAKNSSEIGTVGEGDVAEGIRRSYTSWLSCNKEHLWLFRRLTSIINSINSEHYNFDIVGFGEPVQLSNYDSKNAGTYDWHMDMGGMGVSRKLSLAMQLSHPDEYEGGELEIQTGHKVQKIEKKRGLITVFPSWVLHRVAPVTNGSRQSLVVWISGPRFR